MIKRALTRISVVPVHFHGNVAVAIAVLNVSFPEPIVPLFVTWEAKNFLSLKMIFGEKNSVFGLTDTCRITAGRVQAPMIQGSQGLLHSTEGEQCLSS
jgi:hypothetical protein